jgi:hypothetical protein
MARSPKRANLKPPGRCIFCGAFGLSHEHMWADWLRAYIPRDAVEHRTRSSRVHIDREEAQISRRAGDPHSRRIRCVCAPCNTGWMSQLQEETKPLLVPLLLGESTSLHRRAQTMLAAWVAMTIMVAEHVDQEQIAISDRERAWFREHRRAPPHWRIWIGAHQRQNYGMYTHNTLAFTSEEDFQRSPGDLATTLNTQTSTICLGQHLILHVMSSTAAWSIIRRWPLSPEIAGGLTQIWPVRNRIVTWPPRIRLTDDGIELVANEFLNKANAILRDRLSR